MSDLITLNDTEIDAVAGGPFPWAAALAIAAGAYVITQAANEIIETGEKIHDAVCPH